MVLLLNDFVESHLGKSKARSIHLKHLCSEKFTNMHERYTEFSEKCSEASEICHYLEGFSNYVNLQKSVAAEKNRKLER